MTELPLLGVRFGHVSVVVADWRRLVDFYRTVFGCEVVPPERNYAGPDLDVTWCYVTDPEGNILELQAWNT